MNTNSVLLITFCVFKSFIWNLVQGDRMRKKLLLRAHSTRSQQTINQDSLKKNHQNLFFFLNGCILINTKTSALWHRTVFSNNYLTISHSFADFSALVWSFQKLQHVLPPHIHSHIPNMFMFSRSCLSSCFKVSF